MKAFIEAWLISFLKARGKEGATREEIFSFINEACKKGLVLPPVRLEEVEKLLELYVKWGLVERRGGKYRMRLEALDETVRDMLEKMVDEVPQRLPLARGG